MLKKFLYPYLAACVLGLAVPICAFSADLFVQSIKAPILQAPSLGSPKLGEAAKGELLKELEKQGNWYKVNYKGATGWVSGLLLGPKPPSRRVSIFEETDERIEKGARKRASAFTTAAAARGLAEDRARVSDKFRVDYRGVEMMDAIKISDEEAARFVHEGVAR